MSIPNEALQKLVNEIQSQAIQAEQQISVVKSQISVKQREIRLLELTSTEVSTLPPNTNVYEGVADVDKRLHSETKDLKLDIENLGKKLLYLETTYEKSNDNIARILQSGGRA
ncbi:KE2 family protein [Sclerotinia borealis F-4128]|uniref:KE2 family protein n=1 Tax=Sclerotinia borealis (strain F-4128) TaxID=1432307 RepID=W9C919_SCLBF|nr:KE2 family protein [Sclerotinia borealis F-4128]